MTDVMIDLETFSILPNASIATIGAIKFNRINKNQPLIENCDVFYRRIDLESCNSIGLHIDQKTTDWWNMQNDESKFEIFSTENRVPIWKALYEFIEWFGDSTYIWSHGSVFDVIIIENAIRICNLKFPWKFWNIRDTRTLFDIGNVNIPSNNVHHALYDCYRQIIGIKKFTRKIKI